MGDYVTFDEFKRLDLRVGKIITAVPVEGANRLMKIEIDVGAEKYRISVAGMAEFKNPSDLEGKLVPVITNLKPATMRGIVSEVMIIAADLKGKPILLHPETDLPPGTKIR